MPQDLSHPILDFLPGTTLAGGRRHLGPPRAQPPLVSIIVVVFRALPMLRPLLESVFSNRTEETELIVVDGGSGDGTPTYLRECGAAIDYWLSEPDTGIYDAMNKGIKAAAGLYVLHLNAGDRLLEIPSARLRQCASNATDVACFAVLMNRSYIFRPRNGFILRLDNAWHHQGTFYRRSIHPGYDLRFRVFGDFDLNQRLMLAKASVELFEEVVAEHTTDGISSANLARHEVYEIIRGNFGVKYLVLALIRFQINWMRQRTRALWQRLLQA